ncbi:MAG: hypothetical protein ACFFBP_17625 [Promethearchaeota archaeon]
MKEKDTIIFSETYRYLANPVYFSIVPKLNEYRKIYLNPNDPAVQWEKNEIDKNEILKFFDVYVELEKIDIHISGFRKTFKVYYRYKRIIYNYLDKIKPKAIISCSDMSLSDRILSSWCKKKKIPFIIIQPSFIDSSFLHKKSITEMIRYYVVNKLLKLHKYRKQHLFGNEAQWTYLLLWSKYFIENPYRKNMFFIGNPVFDKLFNEFSPQRTRNNNIIICTQEIDLLFGEKVNQKVMDIYKKAIKSKPDIIFYIKLHPRESIEKYALIFKKHEYPNVRIVKNQDLYDLFRKCDLQISVFSFTSFEAAAMGLPIILINPNNSIKILDHFRGEININISDVTEICEAIDIALSEEYWEKFLKKREKYFQKMVLSLDGKSSERASNQIKNLITRKKSRRN